MASENQPAKYIRVPGAWLERLGKSRSTTANTYRLAFALLSHSRKVRKRAFQLDSGALEMKGVARALSELEHLGLVSVSPHKSLLIVEVHLEPIIDWP